MDVTKKIFFLPKCLVVCEIVVPLQSQTRLRPKVSLKVRYFSWLEYMPVTHGVASSSLVRTANKKDFGNVPEVFFCDVKFFW